MKILTIIICTLLILVNVAIGVILTNYFLENIIFSSLVLLLNGILLVLVANSKMSDGFKVSFHILFPLFGIIELVLAILAPNQWVNNLYLVGVILLITIQFILLVTAIKVSQHNKES